MRDLILGIIGTIILVGTIYLIGEIERVIINITAGNEYLMTILIMLIIGKLSISMIKE